MWCDTTTVYVANDGATSANKVFAYTISTRAHDSSKDFGAAVRLNQHRRRERRDTARRLVQRHHHVRGGQRRRQRLRLQALGRVPGLGQEPRPKQRQRQPQRHVVRRPDTLGRRRQRRHDLPLRPARRAAGQHSRRRRPGDRQRVHQGRLDGNGVVGGNFLPQPSRIRRDGYFCGPYRIHLRVGVRPGGSLVHRSRGTRRQPPEQLR